MSLSAAATAAASRGQLMALKASALAALSGMRAIKLHWHNTVVCNDEHLQAMNKGDVILASRCAPASRCARSATKQHSACCMSSPATARKLPATKGRYGSMCMQQHVVLPNTFTHRIWISCGAPCWAAACMKGSQPMGLRLSAAKASRPAGGTACIPCGAGRPVGTDNPCKSLAMA
jgi:hypothetical protein